MEETLTTIRTVAEALRAQVPGSLITDGPGIDSLVVDFMEWCDATPRIGPKAAPLRADIVLALHAIIGNSKDLQTIQHCLQAMVRSGRFGTLLAARFILGKSVSLRQLDTKIADWPIRDRLAIAHEMLSDFPSITDREILAWLESLLQRILRSDVEELAQSVADLSNHSLPLAFPIRQALMNGAVGRWLANRISEGSDGDGLHRICQLIRIFDDSLYAEALAKSILLGRIKPDTKVIRTIAAVSEAENKTVLSMLLKTLSNASNGLAGACLDAIIAQDHPGAGKLFASIRTKMPKLRQCAAIRVPLLGGTGYANYIKELPEKAQTEAHLEAIGILEAIAPDFVANITHKNIPRSTHLTGTGESVIPPTPRLKSERQPAPGFFAALFKSKPKTLEDILPKHRSIQNMSLTGSLLENTELDGKELIRVALTGSSFIKTTFTQTRTTASKLDGTVFFLCQCTGATFSNTDFTDSQFVKNTFTNCSFTHCTFSTAIFDDCTFMNCRFHRCSFGETSFVNMRIRTTLFDTSSLAGTLLHDCSIRTSRFVAADLTYAELVSNDLRGAEFVDSTLYAVYIRDCDLTSVTMPGTCVSRSIIKNSDASHPLLMANRIRQMTLFAREAEKRAISHPMEIDPFLAQKAMTAWSQELTFMRREQRMLDNNRTRLSRASATMGTTQRDFLKLLPHLLDSNLFERKFGLKDIPTCRVWEYYPGLSTLELAGHHFGKAPLRPTSPDVRILAVYAMGSTGTVAQTAESDFDCWVCYDGDLTIPMENGLNKKLKAIELWAESEFGLETHFFPMRMDDVRDNRFMSGDEESSGSAQVLLLKEEFYRTALKIAGKHIAWWVTPAGASRQAYDACIRASRRYPICGKPRLEDFGYLAPVPPEEYFGGSLWQMVKAVHAPFKSVLKLGLLETYAAPGVSSLPLCERIKRSLIRRRHGKLDTDPYTALFTTLHDYYLRRKENNAAALLKESFKLKINLSNMPFFMDRPIRPEDESLIAILFGAGHIDQDRVNRVNKSWLFDKSLKMGSIVRHYMVSTYQRIQNGLSANSKAKAHINPEDLTRLGRRISANFLKKQHKIMRVPFMDIARGGFPILHFSATRVSGKPPVWIVRGGSSVEAKQSAEALQLLHRNPDPVRLMAWLLANHIYHPKGLIQADRSFAPIAVIDLQRLMSALHNFFPFETTFEPNMNEGLQPERVTRAYFVLNLTTPPDARRVEQAVVIYATNWGEMFCRTFLRPGQLFETNPSRFLAQKLDQPVPQPPEMTMFVPKGSQCRRINLI